MKNSLSILIVCFLLLNGLGAVVSGNYTDCNNSSNLIDRIIVAISFLSSDAIFIKNINNEEFSDFKSTSDDSHIHFSNRYFDNNFDTHDFLIITTEELNSAITSSTFID